MMKMFFVLGKVGKYFVFLISRKFVLVGLPGFVFRGKGGETKRFLVWEKRKRYLSVIH